MKYRINSKEIVVITGAASGIGLELTKLYRRHGAKTIALDCNAEALSKVGGTTHVVDVSKESLLLETAQRIASEIGKPSLWINNAGIATLGRFDKITSTDFEHVMAVNFNGVVFGTRAAMSVMQRPVRGTIVNIASASGIIPAPYMSAYVASKHAVVGFTRSVRLELECSHSPLRLVLVVPGFVKTKIMQTQNGLQFPNWLQFMVSDPAQTAAEIARKISQGKDEIFPTRNGRALLGLHRLAPRLTARSSRIALAKTWKEAIGLESIKSSLD